MKCMKCTGKLFLDRTFTDNENFEVYCIMCGARKFLSKKAGLGKWLETQESLRLNA